MMRGSTPTHIFGIPFDAGLVKEIRLTYAQNGATVLEKTEADCTIEGNAIKVKLTQEETLAFDHAAQVRTPIAEILRFAQNDSPGVGRGLAPAGRRRGRSPLSVTPMT